MKMIRALGRQTDWALRGLTAMGVCLLAACGGGDGLDRSAAADAGAADSRARALGGRTAGHD